MDDRAMAWKERPVDYVATLGATATYGSHVIFAFRFPDNDTEVISAHRAGSGEVYSHVFRLTLPVRPFNVRGVWPIQDLHNSRPCCSAAFFAVKDRPFNAFHFNNRAEAACTEDRVLRVMLPRTARQLLLRFNQAGDDEAVFLTASYFFRNCLILDRNP